MSCQVSSQLLLYSVLALEFRIFVPRRAGHQAGQSQICTSKHLLPVPVYTMTSNKHVPTYENDTSRVQFKASAPCHQQDQHGRLIGHMFNHNRYHGSLRRMWSYIFMLITS